MLKGIIFAFWQRKTKVTESLKCSNHLKNLLMSVVGMLNIIYKKKISQKVFMITALFSSKDIKL